MLLQADQPINLQYSHQIKSLPVTLSTRTCHLGNSCSKCRISFLFFLSETANSTNINKLKLTFVTDSDIKVKIKSSDDFYNETRGSQEPVIAHLVFNFTSKILADSFFFFLYHLMKFLYIISWKEGGFVIPPKFGSIWFSLFWGVDLSVIFYQNRDYFALKDKFHRKTWNICY